MIIDKGTDLSFQVKLVHIDNTELQPSEVTDLSVRVFTTDEDTYITASADSEGWVSISSNQLESLKSGVIAYSCSYTYGGSSFDNANTYTDYYFRNPDEVGEDIKKTQYYTKAESDERYAFKEETYTKSEIDGFIDGIETGTINIIDDLTTSDSTKALSALQGVVLKGLIDATNAQLNGKADADDVYTKDEVDDLLDDIDSGAQANVQADWNEVDSASDAFIKNKPTTVSAFTNDSGYLTQHQTLKTINGDSILGEGNLIISGTKGDKGDKGDTVVVDTSGLEQFEILNSLNAQSAGDALDAYQGTQLKAKINEIYTKLKAVYSLLGNIAFWDGKPAISTILPDLDWGLPKHTVTLDLDLTNAVVMYDGTEVSNGDTIQVEEYTSLVFTVEADDGYELGTVESESGTVVGNTVTISVGQSDVTLDITASATLTYSITYGTMTNCSVAQDSPTSIAGGGSVSIEFTVDSGYDLYRTGISVVGATIASFTNYELVITNATGNVTISATAEVPKVRFLKGYRLIVSNGTTQLTNAPLYKNGDSTQENITPISAVSEYLHVPQTASATSILFTVLWGYTAGIDTPTLQWACYSKDETTGEYTYLASRAWDKSYGSKADRGPSTDGSPSPMSQVCAALQAGTLYVRSTITLEPNTGYATLRQSGNGAYGIGYKINSGSLTELFYPRISGRTPLNYMLVDANDWDVDELNLS